MRRYLKITTLLAVLSLMFLLAACGSDDDSDSDEDAGDDAADDSGDDAGDDSGDDAGDDAGDDMGGDFDVEEFYAGKTVRFITTSGAGGGTDARVRAFASVITDYVPGNPGAQVSNVTPHVAGFNFMYGAEPDGLTIALTSAPTLEFELFGDAEWNTPDFQFVGALDSVCGNMVLVGGETGYENVEEMSNGDTPLIAMTQAPSPGDVAPLALGMMMIADFLEWPLEYRRVAESGSAAQELALERGEVNIYRAGNDWCRIPDNHPDWLPDGIVVPMLDMTITGPGDIPQRVQDLGYDPPHVSEVLDEEQYRQWQGVAAAPRAGGNPIFFPPGTPQEIVDAWREALAEAYEDEGFYDIMSRTYGGEDFALIPGEEAQTLFTENHELLLEFATEYESLAEELYSKYVN